MVLSEQQRRTTLQSPTNNTELGHHLTPSQGPTNFTGDPPLTPNRPNSVAKQRDEEASSPQLNACLTSEPEITMFRAQNKKEISNVLSFCKPFALYTDSLEMQDLDIKDFLDFQEKIKRLPICAPVDHILWEKIKLQ